MSEIGEFVGHFSIQFMGQFTVVSLSVTGQFTGHWSVCGTVFTVVSSWVNSLWSGMGHVTGQFMGHILLVSLRDNFNSLWVILFGNFQY